MAAKRARDLTNDPGSDSSLGPLSKLSRTAQGNSPKDNSPIVCSLPPTCNRNPTPLANSRELENHYATHHANVCEVDGCGSVFPDERFLSLHFTENHDVLAVMRQEKGEKIFKCFDQNCPRMFSTPKTRRMHLIQSHEYPKEYFFAVTNKGIGHLLQRWGNSAYMIRSPWHSRPQQEYDPTKPPVVLPDTSMPSDSESEDDEPAPLIPVSYNALGQVNPVASGSSTAMSSHNPTPSETPTIRGASTSSNTRRSQPPRANRISDLESAMTSLSLVPSSIRFGRGGGKQRGAPHHSYRAQSTVEQQQQQKSPPSSDRSYSPPHADWTPKTTTNPYTKHPFFNPAPLPPPPAHAQIPVQHPSSRGGRGRGFRGGYRGGASSDIEGGGGPSRRARNGRGNRGGLVNVAPRGGRNKGAYRGGRGRGEAISE